MAAIPQWKIYTPSGEYTASTVHLEESACLVAFLGDGATIRADHKLVVWREGAEDQPAGESYDHVVEVVHERLRARNVAAAARRAARLPRHPSNT